MLTAISQFGKSIRSDISFLIVVHFLLLSLYGAVYFASTFKPAQYLPEPAVAVVRNICV
jgi:hypothetical protein